MTRKGLILFITLAIIWGTPYFFISVAVTEMNPFVMVFLRVLLGGLLLLPIAVRDRALGLALRFWPWVLGYALLEMAVPWVLLGHAEQHLSSSLAGMIISSVPLFGIALGYVFSLSDRYGGRQIFGLVLGFIGIILLLGVDMDEAPWWAVAELLIVALCYALGPILLALKLRTVPASGVNTVSLLATAVAFAVPAVLLWPQTMPSAQAIGAVAAMAILTTAIALTLFIALINEVGPSRMMVITYLNPLVATLLGVLILQERITIGMLLGFPIVLIGSVFATWRPDLNKKLEATSVREP